jgi:hypothetical protein
MTSTRTLGVGAAFAALVACGAPPAMMAGRLSSSGGELGQFVFAPDRCLVRSDVDALDLRDSHDPTLVVRIVHPGSDGVLVVVANTLSPSGAREVVLKPTDTCTVHVGYHAVVYGDRGVGVRIECTTPDGEHVSGAVGAGVCE